MADAMGKSSTGMDENVAGALCYVLGWITGVIFLIIEKENRFVRFHAVQSIVVFILLSVISFILGVILPGVILGIVSFFLWILSFVLWALLIYKAYKGEMFKLPFAGDIAAKQADR